jgi:phage shock protein E
LTNEVAMNIIKVYPVGVGVEEGEIDLSQNIITVLIIVGALLIWMFFKNQRGGIRMSYVEVKNKLDNDKNVILLDVRTRNEYVMKHIPNSLLITLDLLAAEADKKLPNKAAEIYVYCASGNRSSMAVSILKKLGYTNVNNLGGIGAWPYETVSGNK